MNNNIPLAIALQVFGSFCFALSAHLQNKAVRREVRHNRGRERLKFSQLLRSISDPHWWFGMMFMGISLACQVTALFFAPVSVVQPVGLLAFPWSMLLQARAAKRRIPVFEGSLVVLTVLATMAFTALVSRYAAPEGDLVIMKVFLGAIVIYFLAALFGFFGTTGPHAWRSLFWASGGAMFYGLEAALVKSLITFAKLDNGLHDPQFWVILAFLIVGSLTAAWMVQQGYATGQAELVVASMTITSPVIAVCYGIFVLGEGKFFTPLVGVGISLCGAVAIAGVVTLTHIKSHQPVVVPIEERNQV